MLTLLKDAMHRWLYDPDYVAVRLRSLLVLAGTLAATLLTNDDFLGWMGAKWGPTIVGVFSALAVGFGHGEKNRPPQP